MASAAAAAARAAAADATTAASVAEARKGNTSSCVDPVPSISLTEDG
eukprot:CAMPEP_0169297536 /NCGR_PEP_ID=MMETSP1016-20121227/65801_1 /TAXON_ID=342587 /ORGANISM="Karlodinium micrum, Strain CCMP2283" /LENGTH=46 /DNA_ID= /DNA_START= /DNA_END= /DNA_ORIENTATION=